MIYTVLNFVDLIMMLGALISGIYLLVFTIASLKKPNLRFPQADGFTRFLVLIPEGSSFDEQEYPSELYRVMYYTDPVEIIQRIDVSQIGMVVVLGETTHVSPQLLKYINDAHYGNAKAVQLCHIVEGRQSFSNHTKAIYEGINNSVMCLGHNRMDWPSALRRVDYAIEAEWLKKNLFSEKSNIENRLLHQGIYIYYLPYACVYSDKPRLNRKSPFAFKKLFTALPGALAEGNIYYADKLLRAVFPRWRVQLVVMTIWMVIGAFIHWSLAARWFVILSIYMVLIAIAVPDYLVIQKKTKKKKNKEKKK